MNFWEKPLAELNPKEWELLCDGCGRCCLKKFEEDDGEIVFTRVVCRYFVEETSRCGCYKERSKLVPDCLEVNTLDIASINWMPVSCAYRLRFEGKPLYDWHPLIAGSEQRMLDEGISIRSRVVSEENVHPNGYEEHIIRWVHS